MFDLDLYLLRHGDAGKIMSVAGGGNSGENSVGTYAHYTKLAERRIQHVITTKVLSVV